MLEDYEAATRDDWSPARGLVRGAVAGLMAAVMLAGLADWLAWRAPLLAANGWLRTAASLGSMFVMFYVVHRASGMTGPPCTAIVVVLVALIAGSQHVVFALHGVPSTQGLVLGWEWCAPEIMLLMNIWTIVGIAFGVLLWRDGVSASSVVDIFRLKLWM